MNAEVKEEKIMDAGGSTKLIQVVRSFEGMKHKQGDIITKDMT